MASFKRHGVPNHWQLVSVLKKLFRQTTENTLKFRMTDPCDECPQATGGFPYKRPVMQKTFRYHDVAMIYKIHHTWSVRATILQWHASAYMLCQTLQWRHNGRDGVSNHQPQHCLLNRLFRRRSKKTSKLRVTGLCAGSSPVTNEFSVQFKYPRSRLRNTLNHTTRYPSV